MFLFCFITLIPYSGVLLGNGLGSVFGFGAVCLFGGGSPLGSCFRFIRVVVWGSRCSWRLLCGAEYFCVCSESFAHSSLVFPASLLCGMWVARLAWMHVVAYSSSMGTWSLAAWALLLHLRGFHSAHILYCLILLLVYNYLGTYTRLVDVYLLICL